MKKIWKGLVVALAVVVIALYLEHRDSSLLLSEENKTILTAPESVKAAHTVGFVEHMAESDNPRMEAFYEKDTNSVPVPPEVADNIVKIITSKDRQSDVRPACIYTPGFVMTFSRKDKNVDLFFCFECGVIIMRSSSDATAKELGLISNADTELRAIFQKLFPKDAATAKP